MFQTLFNLSRNKFVVYGVFIAIVLVFSFAFIHQGAFAQSPSGGTASFCSPFPKAPFENLGQIVRFAICFLVQLIVPLVFAVALVMFLVGMLKFVRSDQSEEKAEGRKYMLWAVIALTVMLGVWGLVKILGGTFGLKSTIPQLPAVE